VAVSSICFISIFIVSLVPGDALAEEEPLRVLSVTVVSAPSNVAVTINPVDGSIPYTPETGFVGSDSFTHQVCDSSSPTRLCNTASMTIVVQPLAGARNQDWPVTIEYDILGNAIAATIQTRTAAAAKVANVQLDVANSTGLSAVLSGPEASPGCAALSQAVSCDQFHVIWFSDEPCLVSNAEMELSVEFQCANGGEPSTCGYQAVQSAFRLDKLFLTYDACPRVLEDVINLAASFPSLHKDALQAVAVSAPSVQGATLFCRCSVLPST
jgi:hypothetical protein